MNAKDRMDGLETAAILAREFPHLKEREIAATLANARALAGYAVAECNGDLTLRQESRQKRLIAILRGWYGSALTVNGDPRGYVVKIKLPSGRYNNWGGEGWGIA